MASRCPTTNAHESTPGHRQPGETRAPEAEGSASQGTTAVRGTWGSEGDAGRPLRTTAGQTGANPTGQATPSGMPLPLRLARIATQAREYPERACHHARPSRGWGAAGTRLPAPHPAQRSGCGPGDVARGQGAPGSKPHGLTRQTRHGNVQSASGGSPADPAGRWHVPSGGASHPGGEDRGPGRRDAAGGDIGAGFLRLVPRLPPGPQAASRPA